MGSGDSKPDPPPSRPVPSGKVRICIVGFKLCPPAGKAHELAGMIAQKFPDACVSASSPFLSAFHTPSATKLGTTGMLRALSMPSQPRNLPKSPFPSISKATGKLANCLQTTCSDLIANQLLPFCVA